MEADQEKRDVGTQGLPRSRSTPRKKTPTAEQIQQREARAKKAASIHWTAIFVLIALIAFFAFSARNGFMLPGNKPNWEFYGAFTLSVFLGVPAWLVWQTRPKFGAKARKVRKAGIRYIMLGVAINVVGVGVNFLFMLIPEILPFVILWYGIFILGSFFMIVGVVMLAVGQVPSLELKIPWKNNKL